MKYKVFKFIIFSCYTHIHMDIPTFIWCAKIVCLSRHCWLCFTSCVWWFCNIFHGQLVVDNIVISTHGQLVLDNLVISSHDQLVLNNIVISSHGQLVSLEQGVQTLRSPMGVILPPNQTRLYSALTHHPTFLKYCVCLSLWICFLMCLCVSFRIRIVISLLAVVYQSSNWLGCFCQQ